MRLLKVGVILAVMASPALAWEPGDIAVLGTRRGPTVVPVATDLFAYIKMVEAFKAFDTVGIAELKKEGRLITVSAGVKARVITVGEWQDLGRYGELRVQTGPHKDKKVYASFGDMH